MHQVFEFRNEVLFACGCGKERSLVGVDECDLSLDDATTTGGEVACGICLGRGGGTGGRGGLYDGRGRQ